MKKSCDAPREESALLRKNDTGTAESKTDLMRRKKVAHEVRGFVSYI